MAPSPAALLVPAVIRIAPIVDLARPELALYRTLRRQGEHRQAGVFVAEGEKVVRRLVESDLEVLSVLLPPRWLETYRALLERRQWSGTIHVAEKEVLETLTGFSMYQGLLAVGRVPRAPGLDDLLDPAAGPALLLAADGLSSAENLGNVVRNAAAFGATGFIAGETCCSPYLRRAVRASMGTVFRLPVLEPSNLIGVLGQLRGLGVRCLAAQPHGHQTVAWDVDLRTPCCVVLGSEGDGIRPQVRAACDQAVLIPMAGGIDSLNVASASAALLYEAMRQRGGARQADGSSRLESRG